MIDNLISQLQNLSRREKIIMGATVIAVLFYITHNMVFESTVKEIKKYLKDRNEIRAHYQKLERVRGKLKELSEELKRLQSELKGMEEKEVVFKESLKARNQIGKMLQTLETTAQEIPMQLVNLSAETSVISKKQEYELEVAAGAAGGKKRKKKGVVQLHFTQNKIGLEYRSDFVSTVKFIDKILQLPYALSILSVDMSLNEDAKKAMGKTAEGSETFTKKELYTIDSRIDMEIYFR